MLGSFSTPPKCRNDAAGRLLAKDGPLPGTDDAAYVQYDIVGRKIWEIGPKGAGGARPATKYSYRDSDDKVTATDTGTVTDPGNAVGTFTPLTHSDAGYDGRRNPVREAVSAGTTTYALTERSFDDRGLLLCQAQRMNAANFGATTDACTLTAAGSYGPDRITHNGYDDAGQLLKVQRAYGTPLQQDYATYDYTLNGKQKLVIDANGNRAEMTFDGFDRQRRWIFPSPTTAGQANAADYEEYGYDALGNRTSLRKRDNVTIAYQYDGTNRLTQKNVPASATGAPGYSVFYTYDVNGLQLSARFGSATGPGIGTAYDGFGRVTSTTTNMDGTGRTLTYQYDAHGNRTRVNTTNYAAAFIYDAADRTTLIQSQSGATYAQFGYDGLGRRTSLGLGFGAPTSSTSWQYDPVGRLQTQGHDFAGTAGDQSVTFGYNPAGQITSEARSNDAYRWTGAANVSRDYSVNGLNQYSHVGPNTYGYDLNGNLTSDGVNGYVYDAENRLVTRSNVTLSYDPNGRLWQVTSPSGTRRFLYDGDRLISEYDAAGTILGNYTHGPGADEPLLSWEASNNYATRYFHADHQGSIVGVADDAGNVVQINAYDPWGVPNATNTGRFGYTGQTWVPELGMWYYKARIYSPMLGRFLQTDPVGYKDQVNLYGYVQNDPLDVTDPSGESSEQAGCGSRLGDSASCSGGTLIARFEATVSSGFHSSTPHAAMGGPPPEREERAERSFLGIEVDPAAEVRSEIWYAAREQIRAIEPNNPMLESITSIGGFVPTQRQVDAMRSEVAEARDRSRVIDYATSHNGAAQPGYRGGGAYANDGRGGTMILPGRGVTFREYDVRPYQPGVNRGADRIVIDSRGRAYHTPDHYLLWRRIR